MTKNKNASISERLGHWFGRVWRSFMRREAKLLSGLRQVGVPGFAAKTLLWSVKLILLVVLLYFAFWLTILLLVPVIALRVVVNVDPDSFEEEPEWRDGLSGYGQYDSSGVRVDPHDPDDQP